MAIYFKADIVYKRICEAFGIEILYLKQIIYMKRYKLKAINIIPAMSPEIEI